jgi:hypothetical protein
MSELSRIDDLDAALRVISRRLRQPGYDPTLTLNRLRRQQWWPMVSLIAAIVVVIGAFSVGAWRPAVFACLIAIPMRWRRWRERKAELEALLTDVDFLEAERKRVEGKLERVRSASLQYLCFALLFAGLAFFKPERAPGYWTLVALLVAWALVRLLWEGRALHRELQDLGSSDSGGWASVVITFCFFAALPFLLLGRLLYRGVRHVLGHPVRESEDDDS